MTNIMIKLLSDFMTKKGKRKLELWFGGRIIEVNKVVFTKEELLKELKINPKQRILFDECDGK